MDKKRKKPLTLTKSSKAAARTAPEGYTCINPFYKSPQEATEEPRQEYPKPKKLRTLSEMITFTETCKQAAKDIKIKRQKFVDAKYEYDKATLDFLTFCRSSGQFLDMEYIHDIDEVVGHFDEDPDRYRKESLEGGYE